MSSIKLPVTYPPLTTFTGYADALAILCSHEEALDWVYSHYVQLYATQIFVDEEYYPSKGYATSFFNDFDNRRLANAISDGMFFDREKCPYLNIFEIPNELIRSYDESFVSFIKRNIDLSMYTYGHADISKIPEYKLDAGSELSFHPVFIYGYDDDKQLFYFADFLNNHKYTFSTCTYNDIEAAYQNINNMVFPLVKSISAVQFVSNASFLFDYSYIRETIREYLFPDTKKAEQFTKYTTSYYGPLKWHTKAYIGIDVYEFFPEYIETQLAEEVYPFDFKPFHALFDHKEMMIKRVEYLIKRGILADRKLADLDEYKKVREKVEQVRNIFVKYNIKKDNRLFDQAYILLKETKALEIPILKSIFDITEN